MHAGRLGDAVRGRVLPALATLLLSTPLRGRLTKLDLSGDTDVSEETILRDAEGCESLVDLQFPNSLILAPEFYAALARARPTLKILELWEPETACLPRMRPFALECLYLHHGEELTPAIIDMILQGRSRDAQLLRHGFCPLASTRQACCVSSAAALARVLVGGTREIERYRHRLRLSPLVDGSNVDEINKLLEGPARDALR